MDSIGSAKLCFQDHCEEIVSLDQCQMNVDLLVLVIAVGHLVNKLFGLSFLKCH